MCFFKYLSPLKWQFQLTVYVLILSIITFNKASMAEEFHVSSANEFQQALNTAASNAAADSIYLASGTYSVNDIGGSFTYLAENSENYELAIMAEPGETPILDGMGAYQVLVLKNLYQVQRNSHFLISGVTIQNGKTSTNPLYGGGLYCLTYGSITIEKNVFLNNEAEGGGGGAYLQASDTNATILVAENNFHANTAAGGGGLFCSTSGTFLVNDNLFEGNNAIGGTSSYEKGGGGIYGRYSGDMLFEGNVFRENSASDDYGGGILLDDVGYISLIENIFEENTSRLGGGGAKLISKYDDILLSHNQFLGNKAPGPNGGIGGGIYASSWSGVGNICLQGNTFNMNEAKSRGGGAYCHSSKGITEIVNNIFSCNIADRFGGGLRLYTSQGTATLTNNTIVCNQALQENGGGGIILESTSPYTGVFNIYNNIIFANFIGCDISNGVWTENTEVNIVNNKFNSFYGNEETVNFCDNDCSDNLPQFVDSCDYHLSEDSPCIDNGCNSAPSIPAIDKDGNPRIVDGNKDGTAIVDRGAYEYQPPPESIFTDERSTVQVGFQLLPNYPNPFNPTTTIEFSLPHPAFVSLTIVNMQGRTVRTLFQGNQTSGYHTVLWDGRDQSGRLTSTGVYFYRFEVKGRDVSFMDVKKMILMK